MALRDRQPIARVAGLRPGPARTCRELLSGPRSLGRALTGPLGSPSRAEDEAPAGRGPTARCDGLARLEAVLFLARQPHTSRKLAQLAGLADGTQARTLVRKLNRLYDGEGSAFRVEEVAGGFQLMSRAKFAPWLRRLHDLPVEVRLSAPAMETLAVVAYRQPVLRAEIEAIRGVQCGEILRQLIERELVRIVGRSQELGRPLLYGTTRQFLQMFGLRHLEELPRRELLQVAQRGPAAFAAEGAATDQESSHQTNLSYFVEEETNVKTVTSANTRPEDLLDERAAPVVQTPGNEQSNDEYTFDEGHLDDLDQEDENDLDEEDEDDFDEEDEDDLDDEDEDEDLDEEEEDEYEEDLDEENEEEEDLDEEEEEDFDEEEDQEDEGDLEEDEWEEVEDDEEGDEEEEEDWEEDEDEDWDEEEEEEEKK